MVTGRHLAEWPTPVDRVMRDQMGRRCRHVETGSPVRYPTEER